MSSLRRQRLQLLLVASLFAAPVLVGIALVAAGSGPETGRQSLDPRERLAKIAHFH